MDYAGDGRLFDALAPALEEAAAHPDSDEVTLHRFYDILARIYDTGQ